MRELDALDILSGSIHKIEYADLGDDLGHCIEYYGDIYNIQISTLLKRAGVLTLHRCHLRIKFRL